MAFNIKKNKRLPAGDTDTSDGILDVDTTEIGQTGNSNVVATHSWVSKVLRKFWNWTKFFATESLQVAGGIHAGRVKTTELQTNDAYATRLTLIDPNGRPCAIYINELGELKVDYDFHDVFVYPGNNDIQIKNFVYRYGTDDEHIAANFVGLTPVELMLNFVDFGSNAYKELNGKTCFKLCAADGNEEFVDKTLLFSCPSTKKISAVKILDSDGITKDEIPLAIPSGKTYRRMTINMPSFRNGSDGVTQHVPLVGDFPSVGSGAFQPFVPPFLLPPKPPWFVPPTCPATVPQSAMQAALNNDIFDDQEVPIGNDIFSDITEEPDKPLTLDDNVEVVRETYYEDTYFNLALKKSDFEKNQEQYLMVETVDK